MKIPEDGKIMANGKRQAYPDLYKLHAVLSSVHRREEAIFHAKISCHQWRLDGHEIVTPILPFYFAAHAFLQRDRHYSGERR